MRFAKTAIAAAAALSMTATPVFAQSAMPLSLVASSGTVGMMQDDTGTSNDGSILLPALVILGVLTAAILITTNDNDDLDNPTSP